MNNYLLSIVAVVGIFSVVGCSRDDDEPERERRSISRLYVSTSDYAENSAGADLFNVWAVDSVTAAEIPAESTYYRFTSAAKGGNMIHYSPFSGGVLFQGSMNPRANLDTAVHVMTISKTGVISNGSSIRNRLYDKVRGLFYAVVNGGQLSEDYLLYANASDTTNGLDVPNYNLFAIDRPRNKGSFTRPRYRMKLTDNPWGVIMVDNDLLISKADVNGGVRVFKNFNSILLAGKDSVVTTPENYLLTVSGANNIRGLAYSKAADVLLLTDFIQNGTSIGRILIFEKFSQYKAAQTIIPTRIVSGALTRLVEPLDVAIDTRAGGEYFFVADPVARRVFRFLIADEGNVAPNKELKFSDRPPRSISLDSR